LLRLVVKKLISITPHFYELKISKKVALLLPKLRKKKHGIIFLRLSPFYKNDERRCNKTSVVNFAFLHSQIAKN
jgi:hypothetical protein